MNSHSEVTTEHRGRPRSETARRAILSSAYSELRRVGFRQLTMEAIAQHAGVGKSTVYRWWPNKARLLFDAVNSLQDSSYPDFEESGRTKDEVLIEARGVIEYFRSEAGSAFLDLVAESRFDPPLATSLTKEFVNSRREATRAVLTRGLEQGQVTTRNLDPDVLMDMVWGAIYYRFLVLHDTPEPDFADQLVNQIWPLVQEG